MDTCYPWTNCFITLTLYYQIKVYPNLLKAYRYAFQLRNQLCIHNIMEHTDDVRKLLGRYCITSLNMSSLYSLPKWQSSEVVLAKCGTDGNNRRASCCPRNNYEIFNLLFGIFLRKYTQILMTKRRWSETHLIPVSSSDVFFRRWFGKNRK